MVVATSVAICALRNVAANSATLWPCAFSTVAATSPLLFSGCRGLTLLQPRSSHSPSRSTSLTVQATKMQVYANPTSDTMFKHLLSSEPVRNSFLNTFLRDVVVTSSERLDEHLDPAEGVQSLYRFLHDENSSSNAKTFNGSNTYMARLVAWKRATQENDEPATTFLHEFVARFDEIKTSFPIPAKMMVFACQLSDGDVALVEVRVYPKDNFDRRALAYVAAFHGNQLRKGGKWKNVKKVSSINILGRVKENKV